MQRTQVALTAASYEGIISFPADSPETCQDPAAEQDVLACGLLIFGEVKTCLLSFLLIMTFAITGQSAVTVDLYQDMESGIIGQLLTNQPQASSHGTGGVWQVVGNTMRVATNGTVPMTGSVSVDGTFYPVRPDNLSWGTDDNTQMQYMIYRCSNTHTQATVGLFLTVGEHVHNPSNLDTPVLTVVNDGTGQIYDAVVIGTGPTTNVTRFAVCQIYDAAGGPYLEIEANPNHTTQHSYPIQIKADTTYWVNLKYDGIGATAYLNVYNATNMTLVGSVTLPQITGGIDWVAFGRFDHHYNGPATHSYFDNILIDYSAAAFPLLPGTKSLVAAPLNFRFGDSRN
jgi:hypothetical protein